MADWRKVKQGDRLKVPAATWNALMDLGGGSRLDYVPGSPGISTTLAPRRDIQSRIDNTYIKVRNDSGSDQERFAVMGIEDVLVEESENLQEFQNNFALSVVVPLVPRHFGKWVILQEPLGSGNVGFALLSGTTVAKVSGFGKGCAEIIHNDTSALRIMSSGSARVLYVGNAPWAVVRICEDISSPWRFKLKTPVDPILLLADAHIIEPDGDDTGGDDDILDPLNLLAGKGVDDEGWAMRIANKYYAIASTQGTGHVSIRNDSSFDLERYDVLGITGVVTDPTLDLDEFLNAAIFTGNVPQVCDHVGKFAIVQTALETGAIGPAAICCATQVQISVPSGGESYKYAEIENDEHNFLRARFFGSARILFPSTLTVGGLTPDGTEWAIVRVGEQVMSTWKATLTEDMGATVANEASADLLNLDGTNALDLAGVNEAVTVHDDDDIFEDLLEDATVYVVEFCCNHYTIQAECP